MCYICDVSYSVKITKKAEKGIESAPQTSRRLFKISRMT